MEQRPNNFSMEEAARLLHSDAGQQLAALLQQHDPQDLQQAARSAATGDGQTARQLLQPLLTDPKVRQLLRQLGGNDNG